MEVEKFGIRALLFGLPAFLSVAPQLPQAWPTLWVAVLMA